MDLVYVDLETLHIYLSSHQNTFSSCMTWTELNVFDHYEVQTYSMCKKLIMHSTSICNSHIYFCFLVIAVK